MLRQYAQLAKSIYKQALMVLGFLAVAFLSGVGAGALMMF